MSRYNRRVFRINKKWEKMDSRLTHVQAIDPELYSFIAQETNRKKNKLELIASENIASKTVLEAMGSILTDKYAEGYPGRRYYGGCVFVDLIENLACERAKALFKADHVNVQPHSGSNANMAIFLLLLQPGDTVLSMDLSHGGHLSHGSHVNISGKYYNVHHYGVSKETEKIDYDIVQSLAEKHKPKLIIAGASAYSRIIDFKRFREIADSVGAFLLADMAHIAGLVAANVHPSPLPHAHFTTSTTHKTLRGPRGGLIFIGKDTENTMNIETKKGQLKKWSELLDSTVMPGLQGGPFMHIIAAKAAAFHEALKPEFQEYQEQVVKNARSLAQYFIDAGIRVVSGGTDNHLMILDLTDLKITGKEAETMLDNASITVNKNTIPFDIQKPLITSGIRIGTPSVTSRGMTENDMKYIGELILTVLKSNGKAHIISQVERAVIEFTSKFPHYMQ